MSQHMEIWPTFYMHFLMKTIEFWKNKINEICAWCFDWWQVKISSGDSLVPDGIKPWPEPMMARIYDVTLCHQATMS